MGAYEIAAERCTLFDQGRHELLGDYPWLTWMREVSGNRRLFAVRFRATGRFGVCVWVYAPGEEGRPIFDELIGFSGSPTAPWPEGLPDREWVKQRLRPYEEHRAQAQRADRDQAAARREEIEKQADARKTTAKVLRKRGMTNTADLMERGALPVNHNEEARREWNDEFQTARRRSVTFGSGR